MKTFTHPDVLTKGVAEGWAEAETDCTKIDWAARQAVAVIPFEVVDGRPINPAGPTKVRYGRNELGMWGEQVAADTIVTVRDAEGNWWILLVERGDGLGWAVPGGMLNTGETPFDAAIRELFEETGLDLAHEQWRRELASIMPDPRGSGEAWVTAVAFRCHLGRRPRAEFPVPVGGDDAKRAEWVRADTYIDLVTYLADTYQGKLFAAHQPMLADLLG